MLFNNILLEIVFLFLHKCKRKNICRIMIKLDFRTMSYGHLKDKVTKTFVLNIKKLNIYLIKKVLFNYF